MASPAIKSLFVCLGLIVPLGATAATVGFEDGAEGNLNGSEVFSGLVTVNGNGKTLGLFNSNCQGNGSTQFSIVCTGDDPDLATGSEFGTDPQGLVLIIEENPGNGTPDDDRRGGKITFDFLKAVTFNSVSLLDLDRDFKNLVFDFVLGDGSTLFDVKPTDITLLSSVENDNSLRRFDFGLGDVVSMHFTTKDSGAVASLDITPVPLPAAGWLLLGGLGGLVAMKRRKARAVALYRCCMEPTVRAAPCGPQFFRQ